MYTATRAGFAGHCTPHCDVAIESPRSGIGRNLLPLAPVGLRQLLRGLHPHRRAFLDPQLSAHLLLRPFRPRKPVQRALPRDADPAPRVHPQFRGDEQRPLIFVLRIEELGDVLESI